MSSVASKLQTAGITVVDELMMLHAADIRLFDSSRPSLIRALARCLNVTLSSICMNVSFCLALLALQIL